MSMNLNEIKAQQAAQSSTRANSGKGFTPSPKTDRAAAVESEPIAAPTASTAVPQARGNALALSTQSHEAMNSLQTAGLQNAAAYVQRKQMERNAVVDKVSDAIAYLSDPDLLEADIMSAAAAKIAARSGAWDYAEPAVDFDNLFALPMSSQRMLGGA
jgi:hypothetical protein